MTHSKYYDYFNDDVYGVMVMLMTNDSRHECITKKMHGKAFIYLLADVSWKTQSINLCVRGMLVPFLYFFYTRAPLTV